MPTYLLDYDGGVAGGTGQSWGNVIGCRTVNSDGSSVYTPKTNPTMWAALVAGPLADVNLSAVPQPLASAQAAAHLQVDTLTYLRTTNGINYNGNNYPLDAANIEHYHAAHYRAFNATYPFNIDLSNWVGSVSFNAPSDLQLFGVAVFNAMVTEYNAARAVHTAINAATTLAGVASALATDTRNPAAALVGTSTGQLPGHQIQIASASLPAMGIGVNTTVTVTFPFAFADTAYNVIPVVVGTQMISLSCTVVSQTATSVVVKVSNLATLAIPAGGSVCVIGVHP